MSIIGLAAFLFLVSNLLCLFCRGGKKVSGSRKANFKNTSIESTFITINMGQSNNYCYNKTGA